MIKSYIPLLITTLIGSIAGPAFLYLVYVNPPIVEKKALVVENECIVNRCKTLLDLGEGVKFNVMLDNPLEVGDIVMLSIKEFKFTSCIKKVVFEDRVLVDYIKTELCLYPKDSL